MTVRVLIADDQALVRAGFRGVLESEPGIEVVGEACDGAASNRHRPPIRGTSCPWTSACPGSTGSRPPAACSPRPDRARGHPDHLRP